MCVCGGGHGGEISVTANIAYSSLWNVSGAKDSFRLYVELNYVESWLRLMWKTKSRTLPKLLMLKHISDIDRRAKEQQHLQQQKELLVLEVHRVLTLLWHMVGEHIKIKWKAR